VPDVGDHLFIITLRVSGVNPGVQPVTHVAAELESSRSTSHNFPAFATTQPDSRVLLIASSPQDINGAYIGGFSHDGTLGLPLGASSPQIFISGTNQGNGGQLGIWSGVKATPGDIGDISFTTIGANACAKIVVGLVNTDAMPTPSYEIEPDVTEANEGDTVTFDIAAPSDDTLYYQITGDIDADDIDVALSGSITITSGTGTLAITLLEDGTLEGSEEFA